MPRKLVPYGIISILYHQHSVKLHFYLRVTDATGCNFFINISVAGLIQCKMADEIIHVRQISVISLMLLYDFGGILKKLLSRSSMHFVPNLINLIIEKWSKIKKNIRSVQTNQEQLRIFLHYFSFRLAKNISYFLSYNVHKLMAYNISFSHDVLI